MGRSMGGDSLLYLSPYLLFVFLPKFGWHLYSWFDLWELCVFFFWVLLSFSQWGNNRGGIFLLSLLDECNFVVGRRDIRIWSPKPSVGFSCKSFFRLLLDGSLS